MVAGVHRRDLSLPGPPSWCVCGGSGNMHHTPKHRDCDPRCQNPERNR